MSRGQQWQEGFWETMKNIFDETYKADFEKVNILFVEKYSAVINVFQELTILLDFK
jgi:hypothetical protein